MTIVALSPEWWEARRGKITSSRMHTALRGRADGKNTLLGKLEYELSSDWQPPADLDLKALNWGKKYEPICIDLIGFMYDITTTNPGFLVSSECPIIGTTADWMAEDGMIAGEVKCPLMLKHHTKLSMGLQYQRQYSSQVQCHLLVTGAMQAWFTSYHPKAPHGARLYREIVKPDREIHDKMLESCTELNRMLHSGSRFGKGTTKSELGVPQLF